jgi:hypothetical protein
MWMRDTTSSAEAIMINWLAQGLLDSAGFVASCFITREAPNSVLCRAHSH